MITWIDIAFLLASNWLPIREIKHKNHQETRFLRLKSPFDKTLKLNLVCCYLFLQLLPSPSFWHEPSLISVRFLHPSFWSIRRRRTQTLILQKWKKKKMRNGIFCRLNEKILIWEEKKRCHLLLFYYNVHLHLFNSPTHQSPNAFFLDSR